MGRKIKFTILFVVVFIAGGLMGVVLTSIQFQKMFVARFYNDALTEMAVDAQQLSQGSVSLFKVTEKT